MNSVLKWVIGLVVVVLVLWGGYVLWQNYSAPDTEMDTTEEPIGAETPTPLVNATTSAETNLTAEVKSATEVKE